MAKKPPLLIDRAHIVCPDPTELGVEPVTSLDLLPHQIRALGRTVQEGANALFFPYGSGKTVTALYAAAQVMHTSQERLRHTPEARAQHVVLVFCTNHTRLTWIREISRMWPWCINQASGGAIWMPYEVYGATGLKALAERLNENKKPLTLGCTPIFVLVSHHLIKKHEAILRLLAMHPATAAVVCDESTKIKNASAQVTQAALAVSADATPRAIRLILTGRPMPENPTEIWSQFQFAYPGRNPLGDTYYAFLRTWFLKTDHGYVLRHDKERLFYERIGAASTWLSLHEQAALTGFVGVQSRYILECWELSPQQRKLLDTLYATWGIAEKDIEACSLNVGGLYTPPEQAQNDDPDPDGVDEEYCHLMSVLQKATQISSGFVYVRNSRGGRELHYLDNPKVTHLTGLISELIGENPNRRIVIWSAYIAERWILLNAIREVCNVSAIVGPRAEALQAFAAGHAQVIIMPASITQGFNELVCADTAIFFSQTWSAEHRAQAEARLVRLGQKSPIVTFIDLAAADAMDMTIAAMLQSKTFSPEKAVTLIRKRHEDLTT